MFIDLVKNIIFLDKKIMFYNIIMVLVDFNVNIVGVDNTLQLYMDLSAAGYERFWKEKEFVKSATIIDYMLIVVNDADLKTNNTHTFKIGNERFYKPKDASNASMGRYPLSNNVVVRNSDDVNESSSDFLQNGGNYIVSASIYTQDGKRHKSDPSFDNITIGTLPIKPDFELYQTTVSQLKIRLLDASNLSPNVGTIWDGYSKLINTEISYSFRDSEGNLRMDTLDFSYGEIVIGNSYSDSNIILFDVSNVDVEVVVRTNNIHGTSVTSETQIFKMGILPSVVQNFNITPNFKATNFPENKLTWETPVYLGETFIDNYHIYRNNVLIKIIPANTDGLNNYTFIDNDNAYLISGQDVIYRIYAKNAALGDDQIGGELYKKVTNALKPSVTSFVGRCTDSETIQFDISWNNCGIDRDDLVFDISWNNGADFSFNKYDNPFIMGPSGNISYTHDHSHYNLLTNGDLNTFQTRVYHKDDISFNEIVWSSAISITSYDEMSRVSNVQSSRNFVTNFGTFDYSNVYISWDDICGNTTDINLIGDASYQTIIYSRPYDSNSTDLSDRWSAQLGYVNSNNNVADTTILSVNIDNLLDSVEFKVIKRYTLIEDNNTIEIDSLPFIIKVDSVSTIIPLIQTVNLTTIGDDTTNLNYDVSLNSFNTEDFSLNTILYELYKIIDGSENFDTSTNSLDISSNTQLLFNQDLSSGFYFKLKATPVYSYLINGEVVGTFNGPTVSSSHAATYPNAVNDLLITNVDSEGRPLNGELKLTWDYPDDLSGITQDISYNIYLFNTAKDGPAEVPVATTSNLYYTHENLDNYTEYTYYVECEANGLMGSVVTASLTPINNINNIEDLSYNVLDQSGASINWVFDMSNSDSGDISANVLFKINVLNNANLFFYYQTFTINQLVSNGADVVFIENENKYSFTYSGTLAASVYGPFNMSADFDFDSTYEITITTGRYFAVTSEAIPSQIMNTSGVDVAVAVYDTISSPSIIPFTLVTPSTTAIKVNWNGYEHINGLTFINYKLTIKESTSDEVSTIWTTSTEYIFTGLSTSTSYDITIAPIYQNNLNDYIPQLVFSHTEETEYSPTTIALTSVPKNTDSDGQTVELSWKLFGTELFDISSVQIIRTDISSEEVKTYTVGVTDFSYLDVESILNGEQMSYQIKYTFTSSQNDILSNTSNVSTYAHPYVCDFYYEHSDEGAIGGDPNASSLTISNAVAFTDLSNNEFSKGEIKICKNGLDITNIYLVGFHTNGGNVQIIDYSSNYLTPISHPSNAYVSENQVVKYGFDFDGYITDCLIIIANTSGMEAYNLNSTAIIHHTKNDHANEIIDSDHQSGFDNAVTLTEAAAAADAAADAAAADAAAAAALAAVASQQGELDAAPFADES